MDKIDKIKTESVKRVLRIGHKGACGYEPENTLASFEKAVKMGADMVELDVRLTKDCIPVVIHDNNVKRTTNAKGRVSKMTLSEIKELRIDDEHAVPTLEEVVELCSGQCLMDIELKVDAVKEVIGIVEQYDMVRDVIITSFNHKLLKRVHEINPEIRTGALFNQHSGSYLKFSYRLYTKMLIRSALSNKADVLLPHYSRIKDYIVRAAHSNELAVYAWTVNDLDEMAKLKDMGVDAIISDYPDKI